MQKGRLTVKEPRAMAVRRTLGNLPVVDAADSLRIFVSPADIASAKRKDTAQCVLANACKRAFGSSKVLFFRTRAYVELPDKKGKRRIERFAASRDVRKLIETFDRGGKVKADSGFVLSAITPGRSFESRKKSRDASRANVIRGSKRSGEKMSAYKHKPFYMDLAVRDGRGGVHLKSAH